MLAGKIYTPELAQTLEDLVDYVWGFESDEFSAGEANLTRQEAEIMAAQLIQRRCYHCAYESDGIVLVELLATLRWGVRK